MVTVSARRELVRFGQVRGLSERHALRLADMSAILFRYQRREDRNQVLRQRIVDMAHRHRRHGYRMIYLRLRQEGLAAQPEARTAVVSRRAADGARAAQAQEGGVRGSPAVAAAEPAK